MFRRLGQSEPTPEVQYHIALCEERLGNVVVALGEYELALAKADELDDALREEVEQKVETLRATIPRLVVKRGHGAEAASIELDGTQLGAGSIGTEMPIDPGPHTVTAKAPGRKDFTSTISIDQTGKQTLLVSMEASERTAMPAAVAVPSHQSTLDEPDRTVTYVVGGAGVAGLLACGAFLALRQDALNDMEAMCGPGGVAMCDVPPERRDDAAKYRDRSETYAVLAGASGAVGLGALSVAAVMLLTESRQPAQAGVHLTPTVAGAHAGMSLYGRF